MTHDGKNFRMSDARLVTDDLALVNFDVEEFLQKEECLNAIKLPVWTNPDKKIEDYKRRLEKHKILRDEYHKKFVDYKIMLKRTHTGEKENKPPTKSFYEFVDKVSLNPQATVNPMFFFSIRIPSNCGSIIENLS